RSRTRCRMVRMLVVAAVIVMGVLALPVIAQNVAPQTSNDCRLWFDNWPAGQDLPPVSCADVDRLRAVFPQSMMLYGDPGVDGLLKWERELSDRVLQSGDSVTSDDLQGLQTQIDRMLDESRKAFDSVRPSIAVPGVRWGNHAATGGFRIQAAPR